MRAPISLAISVVSIAGSHAPVDREHQAAAAGDRLRPPTACRGIAACRRARRRRARARDAPGRARRPRPDDARSLRICFCQSGPSSACMRRLTKAQPMGGASLCSFVSSAAYSGGSASGMVAISCATFMIGPLRPPSAAASSMAFLPRSRLHAEEARVRPCAPPPRPHWRRRGRSARRGRRNGWLRYRSDSSNLTTLHPGRDRRSAIADKPPYAFGQLSRIQRARLSSLTSPAASDSIIAVACVWSGEKRTPFLSEESDHRHERDALVAIDKGVILRAAQTHRRRQARPDPPARSAICWPAVRAPSAAALRRAIPALRRSDAVDGCE